jgi:hypothetical protein
MTVNPAAVKCRAPVKKHLETRDTSPRHVTEASAQKHTAVRNLAKEVEINNAKHHMTSP